MIDAAFLLVMFSLLGVLVCRTPSEGAWVVRSLLAVGAGGVLLAVVIADGFSTLRLLDYLTFVVLPLGSCLLALKGLAPGPGRVVLAGLAPAGLVLVGVWSHWIEPNWLEVNAVTLRSPKIARSLNIAVVADLQTDHIGGYERRVIRQVMAQQPDLILLTGDYLQASKTDIPRLTEQLRQLLQDERFSAPLGVFAVRGDVDREAWTLLFEGLPIKALESNTTLELEDFTLSALAAVESRHGPVTLPPSERFHIVFGHAPDYAMRGLDADLQIAGHTHGGQVRLPFFGPPITFSRVPRSWAAGVTDLGGGRTLVVSRGIGMERGPAPRVRFLCRPEIVVIHLLPADSVAARGDDSAEDLG